jgi:hypothetical protein
MPDTLSREKIDAFREDHSEHHSGPEGIYCNECDYQVPCPTMRLLTHIDALTAADAWAEVKSAIGEGFVVTVTLNTLGTYVAAAWPGGNYVGDPAYLTDRPEATADAALRALALAILRGTPQ